MAGCGNSGGNFERAYVFIVYSVCCYILGLLGLLHGIAHSVEMHARHIKTVGSYQLCTDALRRSQLMREQPHEHRCEQNFANYPKYDFDSCFNRLRDWLSAMRTSSRVRNYIATAIWTPFNHRGEFWRSTTQ